MSTDADFRWEGWDLDPKGLAWKATLDPLEPTNPHIPPDFPRIAQMLDLDRQDAAELPELTARILADPVLGDLARRFTTYLRGQVGRRRPLAERSDPVHLWPALPHGPLTDAVYLPAFLDTADAAASAFSALGADPGRVAASLGDFGQQLRVHRRIFGRLGTFVPFWLVMTWSTELISLGRLQGEWQDGGEIGLHIPERGPFTPAEVDASLADARANWVHWFGGDKPHRFGCYSWLLDPQLREILRPGSNILAFQERFTLGEPRDETDAGVLEFVFRIRDVDYREVLDRLPTRSSLERGIVEFWKQGKHFRLGYGWIPFTP